MQMDHEVPSHAKILANSRKCLCCKPSSGHVRIIRALTCISLGTQSRWTTLCGQYIVISCCTGELFQQQNHGIHARE